jgi:hypothetical protein
MWVTVVYEGVPIGAGELTVSDQWFTGDIDPLPGYAAVQPAMAEASRALVNYGFLPPGDGTVGGVTPEGDAAGRKAIARKKAIETALELRDVHGAELSTEFVSLWVRAEGFELIGSFDIAQSTLPARRSPPPIADGGHASPTA